MLNYKSLTKELIDDHIKILTAKTQINAITTALIGAIGLGEKVTLINYKEEDMKKLDLSNNIQIFKDSKKTVNELENFLVQKHNELELLAKIYRSQNSEIKKLFKMTPSAFLNQYFLIPKDKVLAMQSRNIFKLCQDAAEEQKVSFNFISQDNGVFVFFKSKEDLYKLQQIFCKLNVKDISYNKQQLILNEEIEEYLPYLHL